MVLVHNIAEAGRKEHKVEDLTKGGKPFEDTSFNLGPTGLRGWAFREGTSTEKSRQILVKEVAKGSPADGIIEKGDVILGANGKGSEPKHFSDDARFSFAEAVIQAEARDPAVLQLLCWRKGKTERVELKLETLGAYAPTAPYGCKKSKQILINGLEAFYKANEPGAYSLGILPFLAADAPEIPNRVKYQEKAKEWAHGLILSDEEIEHRKSDAEPRGGKPVWGDVYRMVVLSEYYYKTRDKAVLPTLEAYAIHFAKNQSWFGTTGHRYAEKRPDGGNNGPMSGYGAINGTGVVGFYGMLLARKAGVQHSVLDAAIKRSENFFASYAGKSGIPYGEHPYGTGGGGYDMNGKCATVALAFMMQEHRAEETKFFGRMTMASSRGRQGSHGGPFFNYVWPALGAAAVGKEPVNHYFKRTVWLNDLDRRWDGKIVHSSFGAGNRYRDFPAELTVLLTCALPYKQLFMTGRGHDASRALSASEIAETKASEDFSPSSATDDQLIAALKDWSPVVRSGTLKELQKRYRKSEDKGLVAQKIQALLKDPEADRFQKAASCMALGMIADNTAGDLLAKALEDEDSYVRYAAAYGLRQIDSSEARKHLKTILKVAADTVKPVFPIDDDDPLQFAHHQVAMLLFYNGNAYGPKGLLARSIDGVDRDLLWPAVRAVARTPTGMGRSTVGSTYELLSKEEVKELADTIIESVRITAPADAMFSNGIRRRGIDALQRHGYAEGIGLSASLADRLGGYAVKILGLYSGSALKYHPEIMHFLNDQWAVQGADTGEVIQGIVAGTHQKLSLLKEIRSVVAEPKQVNTPKGKVLLRVDAVNHAVKEEGTFYTWKMIYGPSEVSFTPNGTWNSKNTSVEFHSDKPGKYLFEVEMSDRLGYTTTKDSVTMICTGPSGKLPRNRAPVAENQEVLVQSGVEHAIVLQASDPDGDLISYVIDKAPEFGKLSGQGNQLSYQSDYGYQGKDTFTYNAYDAQGAEALGKVIIQVSPGDVGLTLYERFDYKTGPLFGQTAKGVGLKGSWEADSSRHFEMYTMTEGSFSYSAFPSVGQKIQSGANGRARMMCAVDLKAFERDGLLEDGEELWFSFYLGMLKANQGHGFLNLGLMSRNEVDEASVGMRLQRGNLYSIINDQQGETRMHGNIDIKFPVHAPHLIVGKVSWSADPEGDDTVEIYRVLNIEKLGPVKLEEPVSTQRGKVDQSRLNTLYFNYKDKFLLDEIRVGPTYKSVLLGTKPR